MPVGGHGLYIICRTVISGQAVSRLRPLQYHFHKIVCNVVSLLKLVYRLFFVQVFNGNVGKFLC